MSAVGPNPMSKQGGLEVRVGPLWEGQAAHLKLCETQYIKSYWTIE